MDIKDIENIYALSPVQETILARSLEMENGTPWHQFVCELQGALDFETFSAAWKQTVQQHPALRTSFFWKRLDKPVQVVHKQVDVPVESHDWRGLATVEQNAQLQSLLSAQRDTPVDLTKAPLIRIALCRTSEDVNQLVCSYQPLLLDGPSLTPVLKELLRQYERMVQGQSAEAEIRQPFQQYLAWLKQRDVVRAESFWREMLDGIATPTPLGVGRSTRNTIGPRQIFKQERRLSSSTSQSLQQLTAAHGLDSQTILLGAWSLLLNRYSREAAVVFGVRVSGRPHDLERAESILGVFEQTLPMRIALPAAQPVLSWLKDLHSKQQTFREFSFYSPAQGDALAFESQLALDHSQNTAELDHNGSLRVDNVRTYADATAALRLSLVPGSELVLRIDYDERRFATATIRLMLGHLETLLEGIAADPQQRLSSLSCLTEAERQQLLIDWNPKNEYPQPFTLHELFEAQVERTPGAIAVSIGDEQLTYRELNTRANQLAHHLQKRGVGSEELVGLCMERSIELVIGVLGIIKAGGAYLPLDPAYPKDRLAFMLDDSQVRVVVTEERLLNSLPTEIEHLVCFERDTSMIARESDANPASGSLPDHLAYVIYTSGSTGRPKGAMVTHANVTRLFAATEAWFEFNDRDVWTLFHSYAFDFSVWEIWGALLYGGRLAVVPYWISRSPNTFYDFLCAQRVTVLNQTPSAFYQLIRAQESANTAREHSLRYVIFGGEALDLNNLRPWFERNGDTRPQLVNMYGITETTVHVTYRPLTTEDLRDASVSVIGSQIPDLNLYVLDQDLEPVPIGIPGEMYVGGAGLARGYLKRAELTAQRFIPNPYGKDEGERLYRTGDLARFLPSGDIEYLGRADEQVKIRGFRIELGEIETVLGAHASVREAVVIAREEKSGDKRLIAYVVAQSEVSGRELREHMRARLPEYMVPAAVVFLNEMPLTNNGKLDRRALPSPEDVSEESDESYVEPRTAIEELLCGIWTEVLGFEPVGVETNFFELGGHSLLATQVVSRVREAFGVEMALRTIFERPTVAEMGVEIEELLRGGERAERGKIERVSREGGAPLSFAQRRLWFLDQLEPGSAVYNIYAPVRMKGWLDVRAFEQAFSEVIRRHEVLRTTFSTVDGEPVQVIGEPAAVKLLLIDLSEWEESEREAEALRLAAEETLRPFDLSCGPLLRTTLLRLGEQEHVVLLTMHHIISDGWSMGVFVREVATLYEAFVNGHNSPLEELTIQYADYAAWQREWLQGDVLEAQLSYWREQLRDAPVELKLPTDNPRTSSITARGDLQSFTLPAELSASLREISRLNGVTLFMTLLSALQIVLHHYTDQDDIIVGSNVVGRTNYETEPLIGFFINMLVLRTDLSGEPSFSEVLRRVREVSLGAYVHQDVPFEKLIEELQPERAVGRTPLVQVLVNFETLRQKPAEIHGLELSPMQMGMPTVKIDLTLNLQDTTEAVFGAWLYSADLFAADSINRMTRHLRRVLETVVTDAHTNLRELREILTEDDRQHRIFKEKELQKASLMKLQGAKRRVVVALPQ